LNGYRTVIWCSSSAEVLVSRAGFSGNIQFQPRRGEFAGRSYGSTVEGEMRVAPLTDREREYVEKLIREVGGRRSLRAKRCWRNAQKLILADREKRLRYCEGEESSIPHAWVTINGKVVDVTREAADRRLREMGHELPQEERAYSGEVINRRTVLRRVLAAKEWGPLREK
jgi:hypothetical protein